MSCIGLSFKKRDEKEPWVNNNKKVYVFFYRKEKLIFIIVVPRVYAVNRDEVLAKFTHQAPSTVWLNHLKGLAST